MNEDYESCTFIQAMQHLDTFKWTTDFFDGQWFSALTFDLEDYKILSNKYLFRIPS